MIKSRPLLPGTGDRRGTPSEMEIYALILGRKEESIEFFSISAVS